MQSGKSEEEHFAEIQPEQQAHLGGGYSPEKITPPPAHPHPVSAPGETYAKFAKMRKFSGSSIAEDFVKQAWYMEDFKDNYDKIVPLTADPAMSTYADMNDSQLRTYFTWRTQVREGNIANTWLSYAFCYIFELINNIGVTGANDGIDKLITFWKRFREDEPEIDSYMPEWVKDYYILNQPTYDFAEVTRRFPVPYTDNGELFDLLSRDVWDIRLVEMHSQHKISKWLDQSGKQEDIKDCLSEVFTALKNLLDKKGADLVKLYISESSNIGDVEPYDGAVYHHDGEYPDSEVSLSNYETYICKDNKWSFHRYDCADLPATQTFILKTIEIELRKVFGGNALKPPTTEGIAAELRKKVYTILTSKQFAQTVAEAARAYISLPKWTRELEAELKAERKRNRELEAKLEAARKRNRELEAALVCHKATNIVDKSSAAVEIQHSLPAARAPEGLNGICDGIDWSKLEDIARKSNETTAILIVPEKPKAAAEIQPVPAARASDELEVLVCALPDASKKLLADILADRQIPPNSEQTVESINGKALEVIHDTLIKHADGLPCVYNEYAEKLKALLREEEIKALRSENANGISVPGDTGSISDVSRERAISERASAGGIGIASHKMVSIPAGNFTAKRKREKRYAVTLTKGFLMGKYPVTQELYQQVMGSNPSQFADSPAKGEVQERRPVEQVSWYDAIVFCNKLSILVGLSPVYRIQGSTDPSSWGAVPGSSNAEWDAVQADWNANGYRLPTEAEWEYACRAGTSTDYNGYTWNDDWGWYRDNSSAITHEVGKKLPNDWDLYDMRGNVEEWVWDWYDSDADTAPSIPLHQRTLAGGSYTSTVMDPFGPDSGSGRVFRGGSCQSSAEDLVSVYGSDNSPNDRIDFLGFRLARNGSTDYSEEPKALPKEEIKARERSENANGISIPGDTGSASDVSRESVISGRASARGIGIASHVMTPIDAGIFQMGSPAAKANWNKDKRHSVTLPRGFYIGTYPVTQELYQRVMGSNPSRFKSSPANGEAQARRPVEQVSWYDAIVFCNKLSILVGLSPVYRIQGSTDPSSWGAVPGSSNAEWDAVQADWNANGYRLPTEAEWEYACRAGKQIVDDTSDNTGWFSGNSDNRTHEVGKKLPNAWGLYDMHGNVYEWCWDWYGDDYYTAAGAGSDPKGPASGEFRVERGGSWTNGEVNMRSASRSRFYPNRRYYTLGFRVVCNNPSSRLRRVLNNP